MKRIAAFVLTVLMVLSVLSTQAMELPASLSAFVLPDEKASFQVSLEIKELYPYGKEMLSALNLLLPHLSLSAEMTPEASNYAILVDEQEAAGFSEALQNGRQVFSSPLLPNRLLVSNTDVLTALFSNENGEDGYAFHLNEALEQLPKVYPVLEEALSPYAEDKAANYSIKKIGKAKWVRLAKLTKDQSEAIYNELCDVLFAGLNEAYRKSLSGLTFQKALTAAIYYTEENGEVISVYIKGNVKHPNGKIYSLAFQYSFSGDMISYKLELGKGKRGGVSVQCTVKEKTDEKAYSCSIDLDSSFKSLDGKTTWKKEYEADMTGSIEGENSSVQGTIELEEEADAEKKSSAESKLSFELQACQAQLEGQATLTLGNGKNTITDVIIYFHPNESTIEATEKPANPEENAVSIVILDQEEDNPLSEAVEPSDHQNVNSEYLVGAAPVGMKSFTAPGSVKTMDLDSIDSEELKLLQEEFCQNMAAELLLKIISSIPQQDLILFSDNTDAAAFADMLRNLLSK